MGQQQPNEPLTLANKLKGSKGNQQANSSKSSVTSMENQLKNMLNIGSGPTWATSSTLPNEPVKLSSTRSGSGGPAWGGVAPGLRTNASSISIQEIEEEERRKKELASSQNQSQRGSGNSIATTGWAAKVGGGSTGISRVSSGVSNGPVKSTLPTSKPSSSSSGNRVSQGNSNSKGTTVNNGSTSIKTTNPFESFQDVPIENDLKDWCLRGLRKVNKGKDSLNLLKYCLTLDDYGEIRQNLYDSLGPNANDFANEFKKKKRELDSKKKKRKAVRERIEILIAFL